MNLNEYPQEIAKLQRSILEVDQNLIGLAESVKIFEAEIDKEIAFDALLKNDSQRKARRIELQQIDGDFYQASRRLLQIREKRELLAIDLELLRNRFAITKLEKREAIAQMELQAST